MEVMYLMSSERSIMFTGSDRNEIFAKRLLHEFQNVRSDGHFTSSENEKAYQGWLKTLKEEKVCYHATDRLYRKTIKYDTTDTLFLQALSFENSFQGCDGFLTFESQYLQNDYIRWGEKRKERITGLYNSWRETKR